jgi:hypothetical protein
VVTGLEATYHAAQSAPKPRFTAGRWCEGVVSSGVVVSMTS